MAKNIRKAVLLLAMLSVIVGMFTACSNKKSDDGRTTFTVGFDAEFPPYGYKDDSGEYVGFDLDLAQEVCERNGWNLVKQPIDWDSKDMELSSGSIDCIWNGFTLNGREREYTWSKAYIDNSQVVIVKSGSGIKKLEDLKGKVVIVQADSSALAAFTGEDATEENLALAAQFKTLQQVSDYNSAFMNLESGSADAVCMDMGVAKYQLEQRGNKFTMLDETVSSEQYGIGLCLGEEGTDSAYLLDSTSTTKDSFGERLVDIVKQLSSGMLATLAIFFLTLIFSMPLGLLVCEIRKSRIGIVRWIARIYISIMRGTPLMLQLLVVFFGPYYLFGMKVTATYRFYAVIIGFALNYAAYFAEIYRGGIESIPKGQYEAAEVLGYSKVQTFWKIIFPQMVKRVLPPVTNEVITLVKDTSLAFALAYTEMFTLAKQIAAAQTTVIPFVIAGVFYYIFNFVVAWVMEWFEKKLNYYR